MRVGSKLVAARLGGVRSMCALAQAKHGGVAAKKASPTVQRLIRHSMADPDDIIATGPKGTVTPGDVEAAAAKARIAREAAMVPLTIPINPAVPYMLDGW